MSTSYTFPVEILLTPRMDDLSVQFPISFIAVKLYYHEYFRLGERIISGISEDPKKGKWGVWVLDDYIIRCSLLFSPSISLYCFSSACISSI